MSNIDFTEFLPLWPGLKPAIPMIVAQTAVEQSHGAASTIDVTGSRVVVPRGFFAPGTTFRFTLAGSRTGTAGAATLLVVVGSTTVITQVIPSNTAIDWAAQFTIAEYTDFAKQSCFAEIKVPGTTYVAVDHAKGTVDVSQEIAIKMQQTLASANDTIVINYVMVECWKL